MRPKIAVLLILIAFCLGVLNGIFNWNFLFKGQPADDIHIPKGQHQIIAVVLISPEYVLALLKIEGKEYPLYYKISRDRFFLQNTEIFTSSALLD